MENCKEIKLLIFDSWIDGISYLLHN